MSSNQGIFDRLKDIILDALYPPRCAICDALLPVGARHFHAECAAGLVFAEQYEDGGTALLEYNAASRDMIHNFKYGGNTPAASAIASLIDRGGDVASRITGYDMIVPVPLHAARLRERGFNQSELLARAMEPICGVPVVAALSRVRDTKKQSLVARQLRRPNIAGAFVAEAGLVRAKRVLLVDDITTTGGTFAECEEALRSAGAEEVGSFAVCVAGKRDAVRRTVSRQ
ncbi:MAG: ComF family protein [Clostridiales bacterium]|jgi:ComF family protein|nr:ComF family protein [Clostridiales bacterium]